MLGDIELRMMMYTAEAELRELRLRRIALRLQPRRSYPFLTRVGEAMIRSGESLRRLSQPAQPADVCDDRGLTWDSV